MGEQIVNEYFLKLPICIVRPSIVTNSLREPIPGWVDNFNGIDGLMAEIYRGGISTVRCCSNFIMDIVPVDIVCNVILTSAWHSHSKS